MDLSAQFSTVHSAQHGAAIPTPNPLPWNILGSSSEIEDVDKSKQCKTDNQLIERDKGNTVD